MEILSPVIVLLFGSVVPSDAVGDLVYEYTKRLCKNEPTCSLVNHPSIPSSFRSLEKRNCLCDADCREYKDCCMDSMFYRIHDQLPPFMYYCSANKKVYMKTRCLPEWTDTLMVTKCQKSILPLEDDLSVITPLTDLVTGVTYGNVYCAVCNNAFTAANMADFFTWSLSTRCGELPFTPTPAPTWPPPATNRMPVLVQVPRFIAVDHNFEMALKQLYPSLRNTDLPINGYYLMILLLYYIHPPTASVRMVRSIQLPITVVSDKERALRNISDFKSGRGRHKRTPLDVDFDKHIDEWDAIALNATYDANTKLWLSRYKEKVFVCEYESKLPSEGEVPLRVCIPNVIAECSRFENAVQVHECRLRTAVVFDKRGLAYRNKECALCNGVREEEVFVCPYDENGRRNFVNDSR